MAGPLSDVRILELAGLGALPYGSLRLADMGADVIRVDRVAEVPAPCRPDGEAVLLVGSWPPFHRR